MKVVRLESHSKCALVPSVGGTGPTKWRWNNMFLLTATTLVTIAEMLSSMFPFCFQSGLHPLCFMKGYISWIDIYAYHAVANVYWAINLHLWLLNNTESWTKEKSWWQTNHFPMSFPTHSRNACLWSTGTDIFATALAALEFTELSWLLVFGHPSLLTAVWSGGWAC